MAASEVRLSISSDDTFHGRPLIIHQAIPNRRRKSFVLLESIRRCALISGSVLVIVGILLTLFGYVDVNFEPFQLPVIIRRPLRVAGPICLSATLVLWILAYLFTRIWKFDRKSRLSSITLRDRVKLHALAIDVLKKPSLSPGVLHDPHLRRQFLQQLRQHSTAVDLR